jgi:hypothetical protein
MLNINQHKVLSDKTVLSVPPSLSILKTSINTAPESYTVIVSLSRPVLLTNAINVINLNSTISVIPKNSGEDCLLKALVLLSSTEECNNNCLNHKACFLRGFI